MSSLTSKDAILKEVRNFVITENEDRCRQISPFMNSFWKDLPVKNGCVHVDDRIAIPNSIKDAYVDSRHISRELGDDRHGGARMVNVHALGSSFQNGQL